MSIRGRLLFALCCWLAFASASANPTVLEEDFEALNGWLEKNVDSDEVGANLQALDRLAIDAEQADLFARVEFAIKTLRALLLSEHCDTEFIRKIGSIPAILAKPSRVGTLVAEKIAQQAETCGPALEGELKQSQAALDQAKVGKLLQRFSSSNKLYFFGGADTELKYVDYLVHRDARGAKTRHLADQLLIEQIYYDVKVLAENSGERLPFKWVERKRGGRQVIHKHPENFHYAFAKYLKEPCLHYVDSMAAAFEPIYSIDSLAHELAVKIVAPRGEQFKSKLFVYRRCQLILNLNERTYHVMLDNALRSD